MPALPPTSSRRRSSQPHAIRRGDTGAGTGSPVVARSPRNASYTITARLDPASRTLTGEQLLTWRNTSTIPATNLRFHLYYNAWRNTRSSWMRELALAGDLELADRPEPDWGWIDVTSLKLVGTSGAPVDVTSTLRFIAPDDGNMDDRTVAEVPLAAPVAPGETVNVQIAWSSRVPRTFSRTGAIGNYYFLAQWFPEDRRLRGHRLELPSVPRRDRVLLRFRHLRRPADGPERMDCRAPPAPSAGGETRATGRRRIITMRRTSTISPGRRAPTTWSASSGSATRACRTCRCACSSSPSTSRQAERHFNATRAALRYYGEWFGPYPYANITVIDPAWQSGAGGMEYPMLFTAGTRWLAPRRVAQPEGVTVHEAGHQFWYGIVATNEFEHAWMDEGFNTFSTARTLEQFFGPRYYAKRYFGGFVPWVFDDLPLSRATDGNRLSGYRDAATSDVQSTPTWRYWPGTAGAITYNKTALWLNTLERMLGWETLQKILSTYFVRYSFKHPGPRDFFAVANEVSGRDLTWFFDQVYRSSNLFDYAVDAFTSERRSDRGYFGDGEPTGVLGRRASGRRLSHDARRPPPRRRRVPGERPRRVREQTGGALAVGGARALEALRSGLARAGRHRGGRSGACAAARRELHEQFAVARAEERHGRAQVVARVARLAAGSPADLWLLHLAPRLTRATRTASMR